MNHHRFLFDRAEAAVSHSARQMEHALFNRLMYRNKNQHRHGLYFHRLDHVRRILRTIDNHDAWPSIRAALGTENLSSETSGRHRPSAPLALSTLTKDDLIAVLDHLDHLVIKVIPKAAIAVTTQLISRDRFIPFAVTIVACLARIFVIERNLCRDLRKIVIELNILFSIQSPSKGSPLPLNNGSDEEDIGLTVSSPHGNVEGKTDQGSTQATLGTILACNENKKCAEDATVGNGDPPVQVTKPIVHQTGDEVPSLYTMMAKHGVNRNIIEKLSGVTSVTMAEVLPTTAKTPNVLAKTIGKKKRKRMGLPTSILTKQVSLNKKSEQSTGVLNSSELSNAVTRPLVQPNSSSPVSATKMQDSHQKKQVKKHVPLQDDSDSDDLDDIFDALN